jgi:antitoxin ParD1/3/4
MSINLTPEQEHFIESKIRDGKYRSPEEVLEIALQLLDEYDRADIQWNEDVKEKIEAALLISEQTELLDGKAFINKILDRFNKARQIEI